VADLPDWAMTLDADGRAQLVWEDRLLPYTPDGYGWLGLGGAVTVLTPRVTLRALEAGFRPVLHPSAD